jgi:hypothetical protein
LEQRDREDVDHASARARHDHEGDGDDERVNDASTAMGEQTARDP